MKIRKNGKVINLTESDLRRIAKRFLNEGSDNPFEDCFKDAGIKIPAACKMADGQLECLKKLGEMITFDNFEKITSVIGCIKKKMGGGSYPMDEKM